MSAPPLVSVLLPTYNRAHLLPRAIGSVLNQSWPHFELIVVDDASTDDTPDVVRAIVDPRIVYERAQHNRGDAGSRNAGARLARGKYLAFQDSDDEWLPDKLEKQVAFIEALPADCALAGCSVLRLAGHRVDRIRWPVTQKAGAGGWVDRERFLNFPAYLQSILMRRAAFEALGGFDEGLPVNSDWELCMRLSLQYRMAALPESLVLSYETPGSLSRRIDLQIIALRKTLDRHYDAFARSPGALSQFCHLLARMHLQTGDSAEGRRRAWQAVRAGPPRARHWLLAVASLGGSGFVQRLSRWRSAARNRGSSAVDSPKG